MIKYIVAVLLAILSVFTIVQTERLSAATKRAQDAAEQAREYKSSLESLQASQEAVNKSAALVKTVTENRNKRVDTLAVKAEKETNALQEAVKSNRDWADEPIPAWVLNAIGH